MKTLTLTPVSTAVALLASGAALALACASTALAQTPPPSASDSGERIVITGSSLKRLADDAALPVTTITREEIARSGQATAADLLLRLPQVGGGSTTQGMNGGGFTPGGESVALRELGGAATLVLLNGRRLPTYPLSAIDSSFVSLDQIPTAMLERIEILRDGASSVYGSDAIAGVVNFITRRDFRGAEATLRHGRATAGNGTPRESTASASFGFGQLSADGWNAFVTLERFTRSRQMLSDRDYTRNSNNTERGGSDRRIPVTGPANALDATTFEYLTAPGCPPDRVVGGLCVVDFTPFVTFQPSTARDALLGQLTMQWSAGLQAFAEIGLGRQKTEGLFSPDLLVAIASGSPDQLVPASAAGNPFGRDVYPYGFLPDAPQRVETVKGQTARLVLGLRGTQTRWDWELVAHAARAEADQSLSNQLLKDPSIAAFTTGAVSPFASNTAAALATVLDSNGRSSSSRTDGLDGKVSAALFSLPGGPVEAAFGLSLRRESLDDSTDPAYTRFFSAVDYGTRQGERRIDSVYTEWQLPVLSSFSVQLSARHDRYSDFGNSSNPKLALRWEPTRGLVFRASASSGFRAPSLTQLQPSAAPVFANGINDPRRCPVTRDPADCAGIVPLLAGGNAALDPETSRSSSAGLAWSPNRHVGVTVDWFAIDYRDQIRLLDNDAILRNELSTAGALVERAPPTAGDIAAGIPGRITQLRNAPFNAASSKVSGVDIELNGVVPLAGYGSLRLRLAAAVLDTLKTKTEPGDPFTSDLGSFDEPRVRLRGSADWTVGAFDIGLAVRQVGGFRDGAAGTDGVTLEIPAATVWNGTLGWRASTAWTLTFGVNNLLDKRSPYANGAFTGNAPHGDIVGRAWWASVRHVFF